MSNDDLLDELFPLADPPGGCLIPFIEKLRLEPFDSAAANEAIASIRQTIPDPFPTIITSVEDTIGGALLYVLGWLYLFILLVMLALVWFLVMARVLTWQAALIFTFFLIIFTILMVLITRATTASFVNSMLAALSTFVANWVAVNVPLLPAAISHALCVYTYPPDGTPPVPTPGAGPVPRGPCIFNTCGESKKSV